jgi:hypothetical protein
MQVVVVVRIDARLSAGKPRGSLLLESVSLVQPGQNKDNRSPDCPRDKHHRRLVHDRIQSPSYGLLGANGLRDGGGGSWGERRHPRRGPEGVRLVGWRAREGVEKRLVPGPCLLELIYI